MDTDGQTAVPRGTRDENLNPGSWTCEDVAQFLEINEIKCDPLVEAILEKVTLKILIYVYQLFVYILNLFVFSESGW